MKKPCRICPYLQAPAEPPLSIAEAIEVYQQGKGYLCRKSAVYRPCVGAWISAGVDTLEGEPLDSITRPVTTSLFEFLSCAAGAHLTI